MPGRPEPVFFTGTPDEWWDQAEQITEDEAAERHLGSWYIVAETRGSATVDSFRVSRPTVASNEQRRASLRRSIANGQLHADDISTKVRVLVRVREERPEWLDADLVIADLAHGSAERVPWRRAKAKWIQVFNGGRSCSEMTMRGLNPVVASITEG